MCPSNCSIWSANHHVLPEIDSWKIVIGGILLPMALIQEIMVIFSPRSPEVTDPTCFVPLAQRILEGTCTVELPVSSRLNILLGANL